MLRIRTNVVALTSTPLLAWSAIPDFEFSSYPATVTDVKATYLINGPATVFVIDALGGNLVSSGVVSYDNSTDVLTIASDPGGQSVFLRADNSPTASWDHRTSGPEVVWFHNFESEAEVLNFHYVGGETQTLPDISWNQTDGFDGGGCLQINVPTSNNSNASWNRPFSCVRGEDNGRGVDDPGASGAISPKAWPHEVYGVTGTQMRLWQDGYYARANEQARANRGTAEGFTFDGTEFWLQVRAKIQGTRWDAANNGVDGKHSFIAVTGSGQATSPGVFTPNQEIVTQSFSDPGWSADTYPFRFYTDFGGAGKWWSGMEDPITNDIQPSSENAGTGVCVHGGVANGCLEWPRDQWVTLLYHIRPGSEIDGTTSTNDYATALANGHVDTFIEAFVQLPGESQYRTWYSQNVAINYGGDTVDNDIVPVGWNCFIPSGYMNNLSSNLEWYHRYTQIVFSRAWIPPP